MSRAPPGIHANPNMPVNPMSFRDRRIAAAVPLFLLALACAPPLSAQASSAERGVTGGFLGGSIAAGGLRLTCDLCDTSRDLGGAVELAVGAWSRPNVRVGVEGGGWTRKVDDLREDVFHANVFAAVYPSASGFHLIGGLGWAGYRADDLHYDSALLRLGAGWDLPLMAGWVMGNRVTVDASSFGSLFEEDTRVVDSMGLSVVRIALVLRRDW